VENSSGGTATHTPLVHDQITRTLRNSIVQGRFRPRQRLVEEDLARELDVSRVPVRRALAQLVSEGLLEKVPYKGTFVVELTSEDLREIYTVRCALEMAAVELLSHACTEEILDELRSLIEEMEQLNLTGDVWHLVDVEARFHGALCHLSGNGRLYAAWSELDSQLQSFFATDFKYQKDPHIAFGHRHIVDCIEAGDPSAARAAIRKHIETSADRVLGFLSAQSRASSLPELGSDRG
jgi:DNA-binding GntR family transcriptional regulator